MRATESSRHPTRTTAETSSPAPTGPVLGIVRAPLVDEVYERIKTSIMDQVREPGSRVNIDAIARQLAVSPTPVREALVRLEAEGVVDKVPARGYTVRPLLTHRQTNDLFEFRALIEPWSARRAAERLDAATEAALRAELASCPSAPSGASYEDYRAISDHDHRFHDLLLHIGGNESARAAFERTNCHLHLFRLSYGAGMGAHALAEHRAVAEAVIARDPDAAAAAMARHLDASRARIERVFDPA